MVADIVGRTVMDRLQGRALVTKGTNGIVIGVHVHDVVMEINRRRTEGVKFNFTIIREFLYFLGNEDEMLSNVRS